MRLTRVGSTRELASILSNTTVGYILTDVTFGDGPPETIRLNVVPAGCSYWRASAGRSSCRTDELPFSVGDPSLLLSLMQLRAWQENFAFVDDCIGPNSLGTVSVDDPSIPAILTRLQETSRHLSHTDALIDSLDVETSLFRIFREKPRTHELFAAGILTSGGTAILQAFGEAVEKYSQIPELRSYFADRTSRRVEDLGPRGQRFRQWLSEHPILLADGLTLEYVEDELKPLHLSGRDFRWNAKGDDLRLQSVDLLCKADGHPVWCEVKMQGDTWATSAIVQILLYGAMLASTAQTRRLERKYKSSFANPHPWLGIVMEERHDSGSAGDLSNALGFCRHPDTANALGQAFEGIFIVSISPCDEGWTVTAAEKVRWKPR